MCWVVFRWLTLTLVAGVVGFCAVPLLLCAGIPEPVGFTLLRLVGLAIAAGAAAVGLVAAASHLLGVNLLRCPLCRSRGEWVHRPAGGPFLRCPRCGDVHGGGLLRPWAVAVTPREDQPDDTGPRFRPVAAALFAAWLVWQLWAAARGGW